MKILRNFFRKDEELTDEDKVKINSIIENKDKPQIEENKEELDLQELATMLNLEQINYLRELLDKREDELHELYGLKNEKISQKPKYTGEIDIKEPVHEEDLDNKTYKEEEKNYKEQIKDIEDSAIEEVDDVHKEVEPEPIVNDDEYIELDEDMDVSKASDTNYKEELHNTKEDVYLKLVKIFGEKNLFKEIKSNISDNLPKDIDILCIGVRKLEAFNKEDDSSQNNWFVQNIKQLEELSYFKMLTSSINSKELFWDRENLPVLISFKSTSIIKSPDEFEF